MKQRAAFFFPTIAVLAMAPAAFAWNPYPDVDSPPPDERAYPTATDSYQPPAKPALRPKINMAPTVPAAYVAPAGPAPVSYVAPAPRPQPQAVYVAPPAYQPPAVSTAAPAYMPPPAMARVPVENDAVIAAPVAVASDDDIPSPRRIDAPGPVYNGNSNAAGNSTDKAWSFGVEGFADWYREPSATVKTVTAYGALTAGYQDFDLPWSHWFTGADLRASYGRSDYKSVSGTLNNTPEQEYEGRWKLGYGIVEDGRGARYYSGLGLRYFHDALKGTVTSLGYDGYDRNITQFYLPLGVDLQMRYAGWDISSELEYDRLIRGFVSSRLGDIPGYEDAWNRQTDGYGLRADLMFSQPTESGNRYAFGPFVRWWSMEDSKTDSQAAGTFLEPHNTRLQLGAELKYLF